MGLIPAPYQVRGKFRPESRAPGENRDPHEGDAEIKFFRRYSGAVPVSLFFLV